MRFEKPPAGVALVAVLAAVVGVRHVSRAISYATPLSTPADAAALPALVVSACCFVLAAALWHRQFVGLVGGLVFYGLWAADGAIQVWVWGLESVPMTVGAVVIVCYLLVRAGTFDRTVSTSRPELASIPGGR